MHWTRRHGPSCLVSLLGVYSARDARASNVTEVPDNGSEQLARGGAWLARASDPLATTFNPAGLAGQSSRIILQTSLVLHRTCFARLRAASDTSVDPLVDHTGHFPRVCNDIEPALNPQVGVTFRVSERLGVGGLVIGPAAASEKNWPEFVEDASGHMRAAPQRYLLTRQAGILVFPTVGAGYEVFSNLRLGASFGWGMAKLKSAAATVALNDDGRTADNDVRANLQASDWFIPRVSAGGLWSVAPNLDIAGWYQWTDSIRARGDVGTATSYYTAANARGDDRNVGYGDTIYSDCGTGRPQDEGKCGGGGNARVKIALPMEVKVGVRFHQPRSSPRQAPVDTSGRPAPERAPREPMATDLFDVEIDLTWANNSALESIEVRFPSDPSGAGRLPVSGLNSEIPPNADQPRRFRDVLGVRLGGDFHVIPRRLALRAGGFFETAAGRAELQHLDVAPSRRMGFAFGGTYRVPLGDDPMRADAVEVIVGYGHTFFGDQSREDPSATGIGALAGTPCPSDATVTGGGRCSDGTQRYRTRWPVNLGTITNALDVISVGVAYTY